MQFREIFKTIVSYFPLDVTETFANYAVLREHSEMLPRDYVIGDKEEYFRGVAERLQCPDVKLTFLEFGVYSGRSIDYWASLNKNPQSRFIGFDSFEGLPTRWRQRLAGYFSTNGMMPIADDPRVSFIKGWFNRTLVGALDNLRPGARGDTVLVHIDSDLYSSALYCLSVLGSKLDRYHVMFDEVGAGEGRALRDYLLAFGGSFTPSLGLKRTLYSALPISMFGSIQAGDPDPTAIDRCFWPERTKSAA